MNKQAMNSTKFYRILELAVNAIFLAGWALTIIGHIF